MSNLFLRTLREDPADAEVPSHKLLGRAVYVRRAAPGIYSLMPLGVMIYDQIYRVIKEEMDRIGSQQVHFPALLPREPYEAYGADFSGAYRQRSLNRGVDCGKCQPRCSKRPRLHCVDDGNARRSR